MLFPISRARGIFILMLLGWVMATVQKGIVAIRKALNPDGLHIARERWFHLHVPRAALWQTCMGEVQACALGTAGNSRARRSNEALDLARAGAAAPAQCARRHRCGQATARAGRA
ncbi:MAG: hypothetical protein U5M50_06770 [Sphingobium sp.]|nr:hypothetical protein [Sphingobium sp.]